MFGEREGVILAKMPLVIGTTSKMKTTLKMKTTSKMKNTSKRTGRVTGYVPDFYLRCSESDFDALKPKLVYLLSRFITQPQK